MEIIYSDEAQEDIEFWKKSGNKIIQNKILQLLSVIAVLYAGLSLMIK